ncbi:MAG: hypothetical protein FWE60_00740 [Oscillospiraceae bacterium]|nr:hypothetical protein [Oscillospiraceae bacterium]
MDILPNADKVLIPTEKFINYALNPNVEPNKAWAFRVALGYTSDNYQKLIYNIKANITNFPAIAKPDLGYGQRYQVILNLLGENGKRANVLTAWLIDKDTNETRLISIYVDE